MGLFILKKVVSAFLLPLPVFFMLALPGVALLWSEKRRKTGRLLIAAGVLWLAVFSWGPVPNFLLGPLERMYPASGEKAGEKYRGAEYVMVLGGGHVSDPDIPVTGRIHGETLARLVEAVGIHKGLPGSKLVLSGGNYMDPVSNARVMAEIADSLGVDKKNVVLEERSLDTADEAEILSRMAGGKPFVLVTSASHMPRSVALFEKHGAKPIPAPTAHRVKSAGTGALWPLFFPGAGNIENAEVAFHERLGLIWAKMTGQI